MRLIGVVIAILTLPAATATAASSRNALPGLLPFKFGMTPQQVETVSAGSVAPDTEVIAALSRHVTVNGREMDEKFLFANGELATIMFWDDPSEVAGSPPDSARDAKDYSEDLSSISQKYGPATASKETSFPGIDMTITVTDFDFTDGSGIEIQYSKKQPGFPGPAVEIIYTALLHPEAAKRPATSF